MVRLLIFSLRLLYSAADAAERAAALISYDMLR